VAKEELKVQKQIKDSVIKDGGYGLKLSNKFAIGIPDLGLWLPPFAPSIMEVKDLGPVTEKFNIQLDVTDKQSDTLRRMQSTYSKPVTGILVHLIHHGEHRLVIVPRAAQRLNYMYPSDIYVKRQTGGYYDIASLFEAHGVPKL